MVKLIPVKYRGRNYPYNIQPALEEIPCHFDTERIAPKIPYSMHTEYSAGSRKLSSSPLQSLPAIRESQKKGVPKLWFSEQWSEEFALFLQRLCEGHPSPTIIEIHPPFDDYCPSINVFLDRYTLFEAQVLSLWPEVKICLENRYGTKYTGGKFLVSSVADLVALSKGIQQRKLRLRLVVDIPQLFSNEGLKPGRFTEDSVKSLLQSLKDVRPFICGIHIWGRKKTAHNGNLDDYFADKIIKKTFLQELHSLLDDGMPRFFVPEVNSSTEDFISIVNDFRGAGFIFQSPDDTRGAS